jgi:hypothetical protein
MLFDSPLDFFEFFDVLIQDGVSVGVESENQAGNKASNYFFHLEILTL